MFTIAEFYKNEGLLSNIKRYNLTDQITWFVQELIGEVAYTFDSFAYSRLWDQTVIWFYLDGEEIGQCSDVPLSQFLADCNIKIL